MERYKRWFVKDEDLTGLTPLKARDIIIKCFLRLRRRPLRGLKKH